MPCRDFFGSCSCCRAASPGRAARRCSRRQEGYDASEGRPIASLCLGPGIGARPRCADGGGANGPRGVGFTSPAHSSSAASTCGTDRSPTPTETTVDSPKSGQACANPRSSFPAPSTRRELPCPLGRNDGAPHDSYTAPCTRARDRHGMRTQPLGPRRRVQRTRAVIRRAHRQLAGTRPTGGLPRTRGNRRGDCRRS